MKLSSEMSRLLIICGTVIICMVLLAIALTYSSSHFGEEAAFKMQQALFTVSR